MRPTALSQLKVQQTLQSCCWGARLCTESVSVISGSKNSSQSVVALRQRSRRPAITATLRPRLAVSASSEFELQTDLPFAAGQSLRNRAKQVPLALLNLDGRRVTVIEQVEELEEPLNPYVLAHHPSPGHAQVHVDEGRRRKGIAAGFEVASIKVIVAVLIERHCCRLRVPEPALRPEKAAELNLPRQFHEAMDLEGMPQSEIGGAVIERGAIVENSGLWDVIAVAGEECCGSVRLAWARHFHCHRVNGARIGDGRHDSAEAIRRKAVATAYRASAEVRTEGVVIFRNVSVAAPKRVALADALLEGKDSAIVRAGIPGAKSVDLYEPSPAIRDACGERKVCFSNSQDVHNVFVIVVSGDHPIVAELPLNAESVAARVGGGKARIDRYREIAGLGDIERERAEGTPLPEVAGRTDGCIRSGQIVGWTETGELLDVAYIHYGICWNGSMASSNDLVEVVDTELGEFTGELRRTWVGWYAKVRLGQQLCIRFGLRETQTKEGRSDGGYPGEEAREGKRLTLANVCAAEARNVSNEAQTEMIVEETKAAANHGLGINGPGEPNSRGEIIFLIERGIVVPTQAGIDRKIVPDFPVVLNPEAVVVVAQMDVVGLLSKAADVEEEEKAGIDRAELLEVSLGGKELIVLTVGLHPIHVGVFIVPSEFDGMPIECLGQTGAEGTVFLLQSRLRKRSAVAELALIAEDAERPSRHAVIELAKRAEEVKERVGPGLRMRGAGECRLVAILSAETKDERTAGVAERNCVAEAEQKITVAEIGARRRKARR